MNLNKINSRLRELRILRFLDSSYVIKIQTILRPLNREKFDELYVVFDYMETDMAQIIRSSQVLREEHVQVLVIILKVNMVDSRR